MEVGIEKKVVSIRLDEQFIQELKDVAEMQNRSLSNLIETVLKEYVSDHVFSAYNQFKNNPQFIFCEDYIENFREGAN